MRDGEKYNSKRDKEKPKRNLCVKVENKTEKEHIGTNNTVGRNCGWGYHVAEDVLDDALASVALGFAGG